MLQLRLRIRAGDARRADQVDELADQRVLVERVEHAQLGAGQLGLPHSPTLGALGLLSSVVLLSGQGPCG